MTLMIMILMIRMMMGFDNIVGGQVNDFVGDGVGGDTDDICDDHGDNAVDDAADGDHGVKDLGDYHVYAADRGHDDYVGVLVVIALVIVVLAMMVLMRRLVDDHVHYGDADGADHDDHVVADEGAVDDGVGDLSDGNVNFGGDVGKDDVGGGVDNLNSPSW